MQCKDIFVLTCR